MLQISIGIPAYNEEANIANLIIKLQSQKLKNVKISEMIVIASGCTDQTVEMVKNYQTKDKRLKLLIQKKREGKTSADNLFFQKAKEKILVLICADTLPKEDFLENLIIPFENGKVGVTAARIIPLNSKKTISGFFSYLWWQLFDRVAQKHFRCGEALAFRNIVGQIPLSIGSDEVYITNVILSQGYLAKYTRNSIIYNMGPQNIKDLLMMRRRHNCLTFQVNKLGPKVYLPKTMDNKYIFKLFIKEINWHSPSEIILGFSAVALEAFSRILARYDFHFHDRKYKIWTRIQSTKNLKPTN